MIQLCVVIFVLNLLIICLIILSIKKYRKKDIIIKDTIINQKI